MKREMLLVLSCLLLVLAPLACGKRFDPSARPAIDTTVPELDLSEVSEFISLDKAEIVPGPEGTQAELSLVLGVLKDFDGKRLVLRTYWSKEATPRHDLGAIPLPDPVDGKISCTITPVQGWQTKGKGVFRLVEPAR